jgi:hypothetical protein
MSLWEGKRQKARVKKFISRLPILGTQKSLRVDVLPVSSLSTVFTKTIIQQPLISYLYQYLDDVLLSQFVVVHLLV